MTRFQRAKAHLRTSRKLLTRAKALVVRRRKQVKVAQRQVNNLRPSPADVAVKWAVAQEGTTENPPASNRGADIDAWQRRFGMLGQPWCGAFVGAALSHAGVDVTSRIVYTPYIKLDAEAGRNGFAVLVPLEKCQRGDLVLMDFAPGGPNVMHVGIATENYKGGSVIRTIEGNTSSGQSGSQDNGGGVFRRTRGSSVIVGCARPRWPK